ncbi:hypothetical protein HOLleu_21423 [Holothuria leucospilota]|uniref:Uncharacterized protein n=1 Tax=Holothuria leucospilota TaxID=206669 RepID=A0A9Q1BX85_HOLLE|nr:hypothetical protein HOLleu_21423 [Holothuria leucospilota]
MVALRLDSKRNGVHKGEAIFNTNFTSKGSICGTRLHVRTPNFQKIFKGEGDTPLRPLPQAGDHTTYCTGILHGIQTCNPWTKSPSQLTG